MVVDIYFVARAATKEITFVRIEIFVGGLWFF